MSSSDGIPEKVLLIDCDPGVDDCVALMMAFVHAPKVKVVGITCARGNVGVNQLTLNAARIVKLYDMIGQVPIFRGCEEPILAMPYARDSSHYHGKDGLGDAPHAEPPCDDSLLQHIEEEHAVNAIIRLSKQYSGRLQLLCLGALTNIAIASKLDRDLPKRLKSVHIMGGTMRGRGNVTPCAEYNFHADPEAAHIVLCTFSASCSIQLLTFEMTSDNPLPTEWFENLLSRPSKASRFFREVFKWCQQFQRVRMESGRWQIPGYILCDTYVVAVVLEPTSVLKSKHVRMGVELSGNMARGSLVIDHHLKGSPHLSPKPIELVEEVDEDVFRELVSKAFSV